MEQNYCDFIKTSLKFLPKVNVQLTYKPELLQEMAWGRIGTEPKDVTRMSYPIMTDRVIRMFQKQAHINTIECCYNMVQYDIILYTLLHWLKENVNHSCQLDEPYGFPGDHQPDATML